MAKKCEMPGAWPTTGQEKAARVSQFQGVMSASTRYRYALTGGGRPCRQLCGRGGRLQYLDNCRELGVSIICSGCAFPALDEGHDQRGAVDQLAASVGGEIIFHVQFRCHEVPHLSDCCAAQWSGRCVRVRSVEAIESSGVVNQNAAARRWFRRHLAEQVEQGAFIGDTTEREGAAVWPVRAPDHAIR